MRRLPGTAKVRTRTGRLTAALVAFASFAGQLVSLEHLAAGPHVACAEHGGELEDVPSVAHVGETLHDEARFENEAAPKPGHGHEHCVFASHARQVGSDVHVGKLVPVPVVRTVPPLAARVALLPPRTVLYRLAPKTSPPA